jgi:hypothetical protein
MPDQPKHTPTPWRVYGRRFYTGETLVGTIDGGYRNDNDDPRRIFACVNACEGIPTEDLEGAAATIDAVDRLRLLAIHAQYAALAQPREHLRDDVAQPHEPAAPSQ